MNDLIECPECCGNGQTIGPNGGEDIICPLCQGEGWRETTQDELDDMAADAFSDMCESEPPITMQEKYEQAARQKRELDR